MTIAQYNCTFSTIGVQYITYVYKYTCFYKTNPIQLTAIKFHRIDALEETPLTIGAPWRGRGSAQKSADADDPWRT